MTEVTSGPRDGSRSWRSSGSSQGSPRWPRTRPRVPLSFGRVRIGRENAAGSRWCRGCPRPARPAGRDGVGLASRDGRRKPRSRLGPGRRLTSAPVLTARRPLSLREVGPVHGSLGSARAAELALGEETTRPSASSGSGQLTASSGSKIPAPTGRRPSRRRRVSAGGRLPERAPGRSAGPPCRSRGPATVGLWTRASAGRRTRRVRADVNVRVDQRATADSAGNQDPEAREQPHVVQARRGPAPIMPPEQGIGARTSRGKSCGQYRLPRSSTSTECPASARRSAVIDPPKPDPTTTTSYWALIASALFKLLKHQG